MKDAKLLFFVFLFCSCSTLFALQEGTLNERTLSIEVTVYGVDVNIQSYDGKAISYKVEMENDKKVSIIEDKWCVRFRNSHPVKGIINIFVPRDKKIESCRIYASSLNVKVQGLTAIYFICSMCDGSVNVEEAIFKIATFTLSSSHLNLNGKITSTMGFCASETLATLSLKGELVDYNIFYSYEPSSFLSVDGNVCTKDDRYPFDKKKKKSLSITQTCSKTGIEFIKEI